MDNPVTGLESGFVCGESFADFHDREYRLGVFRHRGESERAGIELVGPESTIGATEEVLAGLAIDAAKVNSLALDAASGDCKLEGELLAEKLRCFLGRNLRPQPSGLTWGGEDAGDDFVLIVGESQLGLSGTF